MEVMIHFSLWNIPRTLHHRYLSFSNDIMKRMDLFLLKAKDNDVFDEDYEFARE